MRVLIVEDDPETVQSVLLMLRLRWPHAQVTCTEFGERGVELIESENPDIMILDLGLPDISGFEVLKQARLFSSIPIIILTVKGDESDVVKGLELGADDYIGKPCGQLELLARVNARIRENFHCPDEAPLSSGPLRFHPVTRHLECGGREVALTSIEARILHHLMRNAGRVATYSALSHAIWGDDYPGSVDSLRVHVRRLRTKIEANPSSPQFILNTPNLGYFLAKSN